MKDLLNLEFLYTFIKVAEHKELKKAAESLYKSPSTVSMQIKKLESQIGYPLLERTSRGTELTDKGKIFLSLAKKMINLNNEIFTTLDDQQIQGVMKIGLPTDYAGLFLENYFPKLKLKLPKIEFEVLCSRSRDLRKKIANEQLDLAIVADEKIQNDETNLWIENMFWVCGKDFYIEDYEVMPIAVFNDDCIVRDLTIKSLKNQKIKFKEVMTSHVLNNISAFVKGNQAISLLPEFYLNNKNFKVLPSSFIPVNETLGMNLIFTDRFNNNKKDLIKKLFTEIKIDILSI